MSGGLSIGGIAVNFGNDDIILSSKGAREGFVDWGKSFAVSAPWLKRTSISTASGIRIPLRTYSIEFDKNVLVTIDDRRKVGVGKSNNFARSLLLRL